MDNKEIRKRFVDMVGEEGFRDDETITVFTIDGLSPKAVLFPDTPEMVEEIVMVAATHGLSIIPWGGGTQVDLGAPPRKMDLILHMGHLKGIVEQDHENMSVTAQAGIRLGALQESLRGVGPGFFLPLDPPRAQEVTLGGAVATNASGPSRLRYGSLRDLVLGLEAVIPAEVARDRRARAGGKTVKNVSGYDMSKLYIGSLGSLGIILEITCRILPLPEDRATVVAGFAGNDPAWACTQAVMESRLVPSAIEVFNGEIASLLHAIVPTSEEQGVLVAVQFEGIGEAITREIKEIEELTNSAGALSIEIMRGSGEREFWKELGEVGQAVKKGATWSVGLKASVPPSLSSCMCEHIAEGAQRAGVSVHRLSHAGSGITSAYIPLAKGLYREKEEALIQIAQLLRERAVEMGGSLTVEYAPPPFKERCDVWGEAGAAFSIMERLKGEFDPGSTINPGRFVGGL
ncbi:MAG: FAD-binding oxidoreductase [Deltaproteobacteria bacterium]|nr:FAD-binding oxidoreductase [Deltaproteobacteria bacterium]